MNHELGYILLTVSSVGLFALGGYRWKGWRRYVLPSVCFGVLRILGVGPESAIAVGGTLCLVLHLPYGDRTSWLVRVAVFTSYAVPSIWLVRGRWLEFAVMLGVTGGLLTIAFLASRNAKLQWVVKWKVWEMLAGFLIAASLIPHLP